MIRAPLLLALPLLTAACSHQSAGVTVSGMVLMVGGPAGAPDEPAPGQVTFTRGSASVRTRTDPAGTFSLRLTRGSWEGTAHGTCRTQTPVTVGTSPVTGVQIVCQRK